MRGRNIQSCPLPCESYVSGSSPHVFNKMASEWYSAVQIFMGKLKIHRCVYVSLSSLHLCIRPNAQIDLLTNSSNSVSNHHTTI